MLIYLNGEGKEIPDGLNLAQLVDKLGLPVQRVAVELNRTVVRRVDWSTTNLSENDRIEIVNFVGGGA